MARIVAMYLEIPRLLTDGGAARQTVGPGNPQTISAHKVA